jgi:hypothetical protein
MRIAVAVLAASLITAFLDPAFGLNAESVPTFCGFLVGLSLVLVAFELPPLVMRWRTTGEFGRLRVLPWTLALAAVFVLISRLADLQPGYLYGIVLGTTFTRGVEPEVEGREAAVGMLVALGAAIGAWLFLGDLRVGGLAAGDLVAIVIETAAVTTVVAGLEAVAFGMLPIRFLPGGVIYAWSRPAWAGLFGLGLFAFIQVLIGPSSGYLAELEPAAWLAALGVFSAFGIFSLIFWSWFRFRPDPQAQVEGAASSSPLGPG